jgi:cell division protein FtsI (penicillin-binding protein 3)
MTSWFVGMLPADKPELSVVILIDEPLKGYYGGELCAPVFKRIVTDILKNADNWPQNRKIRAGDAEWKSSNAKCAKL